MRKRILLLLHITGLLGTAHAQKDEKSIAAGLLISIPAGADGSRSYLKPGIGLEALGQYNFSNRSAVLLKTTLVSWAYQDRIVNYWETKRDSYLTIHAGYGYRFGGSNFFIHGLVGRDIDLHDRFTSFSFTLGAGKRFMVNEDRFFDVGLDLVGADAENRVNIKMLFSLFRGYRD